MIVNAWLLAVFGAGTAVFFYHHFVYPVLLKKLAAARRRAGANANARPPLPADEDLPDIALLIPAYNERAIIAEKVRNVATLDYPRDKLVVTFALDGCTDDTAALARAALAELGEDIPDIRIVEHRQNRGKIALLNDHIKQVTQRLVALNDTSSMIEPDALRKGAAYFTDPRMGVVCPTYRLKEAGSEGERAYWDYQTQIKVDESTISSAIGPHGAFYFFRRDLWTPLPTDTINDDFVLPMRIVADGYRCAYDRDIVATEAELTTSGQEFRRRVRIGAGNMQQLLRVMRLGRPQLGWTAFLFWSGKGTRPLIPFIVILTVLATALLAMRGWTFFSWLYLAELLGFAVAAAVIRWREVKWPKPLAWLGYLVEGHTASFIGAVRVLTGSMSRW